MHILLLNVRQTNQLWCCETWIQQMLVTVLYWISFNTFLTTHLNFCQRLSESRVNRCTERSRSSLSTLNLETDECVIYCYLLRCSDVTRFSLQLCRIVFYKSTGWINRVFVHAEMIRITHVGGCWTGKIWFLSLDNDEIYYFLWRNIIIFPSRTNLVACLYF